MIFLKPSKLVLYSLFIAFSLPCSAMGQFTPPSVSVKSGFQLMQNVPLALTDMFNVELGNDPDLRYISVCVVDNSEEWNIAGASSVDTLLGGVPVAMACMDIFGQHSDILFGGSGGFGANWSAATLITTALPGHSISVGPAFFSYELACPNLPERCERFPLSAILIFRFFRVV